MNINFDRDTGRRTFSWSERTVDVWTVGLFGVAVILVANADLRNIPVLVAACLLLVFVVAMPFRARWKTARISRVLRGAYDTRRIEVKEEEGVVPLESWLNRNARSVYSFSDTLIPISYTSRDGVLHEEFIQFFSTGAQKLLVAPPISGGGDEK